MPIVLLNHCILKNELPMSLLFENAIAYPFIKLHDLLKEKSPDQTLKQIDMSMGQPKHPVPTILTDSLMRHKELWGKYPPVNGTPEYREAVVQWFNKRYNLPHGFLNSDLQVLPLSGSREGLYSLAQFIIRTNKDKKNLVGIPNPYYQTYYAATVMNHAVPLLLTSTKENNFFPDMSSLSEDQLNNLLFVYICNPSNPHGTIADAEYIKNIILLAQRYHFIVVFDECYSEIYFENPPISALAVCHKKRLSVENVLVFNSLSKRSNAAGIRSAFVVGDPVLIQSFAAIRRFSCAGVPIPILAASIDLLRDEEHVIENRNRYQEKMQLAQKKLGDYPSFYAPKGSMFLWLDVQDGEKIAKKLWCEAAIKVLPGHLISATDKEGVNPGASFIRIAMVDELSIIDDALCRMTRCLF